MITIGQPFPAYALKTSAPGSSGIVGTVVLAAWLAVLSLLPGAFAGPPAGRTGAESDPQW